MGQYKEFMEMRGKDERDPSDEDICEFVAYRSLFIQPLSVIKYLHAIKYYLDSFDKERGHTTRSVLVKRLVRSISIRYGLPMRDDRENMTIELLLKMMLRIDLTRHIDLCCMAACVIAFLNCLRCGEFTVSGQGDRFLKRKDWKQDRVRGQIYLPYSKIDIFGRGHYVKFRKMKSDLDPVFWMRRYAENNKVWKGSDEDPLFVMENGKPLSRTVFVDWVRDTARRAGFEKFAKLGGISFRRGGAQVLRNQGYAFDKIGGLARWATDKSAARYITLSDEMVDEFADTFDRAEAERKEREKRG